jgi:hypothetical protein
VPQRLKSGTVQTHAPEQGNRMNFVEISHNPRNPLKQLGITLDQNPLRQLSSQEQLREHRKNLESYAVEVLADLPVSIQYHYWPGENGRLYTDSSRQEKYWIGHQIDKRERGGVYFQGTETVANMSLDNPGKVVLWYSPIGPASFDHDPHNPYSVIKYDYGQLYIQYFDGEKINAVALKVSDEKLLKKIFPQLEEALDIQDEKERITRSVLNPLVLSQTIDDFFARNDWGDEKIYKKYSMNEIMKEAREIFGGRQFTPIPTADIVSRNSINFQQTSQQILQDYALVIGRFLEASGKTTQSLSGSCGGSTISKGDISELLGMKRIAEAMNPLATIMVEMNPMRLMTGYGSTNRRMAQSEQKWDYHKGDCVIPKPECGAKNVDVGPCNICKECEKKFD